MSDFMRYDHFNTLDAPIAVLSAEGRITYRNNAALTLSRKFSMNKNFLPCFEGGKNQVLRCITQKEPLVEKILLDGQEHTILLIPDFSPEGTAVLLVAAPLLEGSLCYEPSAAAFSAQPIVDGIADLPNGKVLSKLGLLLVRSFASLLLPPFEEDDSSFTMGQACLFLNRLYERSFSYREPTALAKCTSDCVDMPLAHFSELLSVMSCLSVLFAVNSKDQKLSVILSCENERPVFTFSFLGKITPDSEEFSSLLPGRTVELKILKAVLEYLHWDICLFNPNSKIRVILSGRERIPARYFKNPTQKEQLLAIQKIEKLLLSLGFSS